VTFHNALPGLQGGDVDNYYHLTRVDYTGTGTGVVVRQTAPTMSTVRMTGTTTVDEVQYTSPHTPLVPANGLTYFDSADHTLATIVDNTNSVTLQHGQEVMMRVVNKTGVQINNGQIVYISGVQGNRPTATLAKADSPLTSHVIGVATQDIANNLEGFATTFGVVRGINTTGFTAGDNLYLSAVTAGLLTNVASTTPNLSVEVATALNSTVNGSIFVCPENPIDTDATFTAPLDTIPPSQKAVKAYADTKLAAVSVTAPITGNGTAGSPLAIPAATGAVAGYLASADWTTFNGKQAALGFTPINKAGDTGIGNLGMGALTASELTVSNADVAGSACYINNTNAANWGSVFGLQSAGVTHSWLGSLGALIGTSSHDLALWATAGNAIKFYTNGYNLRLTIDSATGAAAFASSVSMGALTATTAITSAYAVASLPAGSIGMRAFANNALAPVWGSAVVGGGAVVVPVFHDGVSWKVGWYMGDEFLTKREFDGFAHTVRGEFSRFGEQLTQVSTKIDTLVNGRIEEARVMGEITGAIKAINERLERHEKDSGEQRRMHESELIELRKQINNIEEGSKSEVQGRLKGWHQVAISLITAIFAVWAARFFK
jgi:hypothetical protein